MTENYRSCLEALRVLQTSHMSKTVVIFTGIVDGDGRKAEIERLLQYADPGVVENAWKAVVARLLGIGGPGLREIVQADQAVHTRTSNMISGLEEKLEEVNMMLCMASTRSAMQTLIDAGAYVTYRTPEGQTPLHFAASRGLDEMVDMLLIHSAEVDAKTTRGYTPLHSACAADIVSENVVRSLLRAGANVAALSTLDQTLEALLHGGHDGAYRLVRRASELRFYTWLPILRNRVVSRVAGCELKRLRRTSSRLAAGRAAGAVLYLVNVASEDVFRKVVSFL